MIQTNISSLIQYTPNQMFSLNILKILAMISISISHYAIIIGQNHRQNIINSNFMIIMINSLYAVDIFFLVSGFLLARKLLNNPNFILSPFQAIFIIIDRIFRIYPLYWILLIIYIILPKLFTNIGYNETCLDNIFYLTTLTHNIFNKFGCFEWSWYIAVEIQTLIFLCLFLPIINLIKSVLFKSKIKQKKVDTIKDLQNYIVILIIIMTLYSIIICIQNNFKISFYAMTDKNFYYNFYQKPQHKMSSYLIGIITGFKYENKCYSNMSYKILAFFAIIFSLIGWIFIKEYQEFIPDLIQNIYQCLSRPILCLGIVFSGILEIKSSKFIEHLFQIFSKLLFSIYLSHYFLYQIMIANNFIKLGLITNFIVQTFIIFTVSSFSYVFIESNLNLLSQICLRSILPQSIKNEKLKN
ncbi:unnamed protein product [Paramecium sonneborni]|uniref:Acyltransferase 3 domain-containing protein n=1 Tax=Paramecium sonneborni TaxID=65129 RepID=A0A8S1NXF8_9CILI|nr:unnamed protein product [Paramecium sonneborni]